MASKKKISRAIESISSSFPGLFKETFIPTWEEALKDASDRQIDESIKYLLTKYTSAYLPTPAIFLAFGARASVDSAAGLGPEWFDLWKDSEDRSWARIRETPVVITEPDLTPEEREAKRVRTRNAKDRFYAELARVKGKGIF